MRGKREIPFVKPVRIGNFKMWRSKANKDVVQIVVSTLDGGWMVKIPSTFDIFAIIRELFANGENDAILSYFTNMFAATSIPNGFFHQGISLLTIAYCNPNFLEEGSDSYADLLADASSIRDAYLEWRKEYDERQGVSAEDDGFRDAVADDMLAALAAADAEMSVEQPSAE